MIRCILCDIEGTTTALSFVHDVLFPISRKEVDPYIRKHWNSPELQQLIMGVGSEPGEAIKILQEWIDADNKDGRLKQIQGKIWKKSFESGRIQAPVYPDVPRKWIDWKQRGLRIYIFSSGSVEAQKLLFQYSGAGDLTPLIDGYFDTTTGPKKDRATYDKIAAALKLKAEEVLFLSDVAEELNAARAVGMSTFHLDREGTVRESAHPIAQTFEDVVI